jgi:hypothetical protein
MADMPNPMAATFAERAGKKPPQAAHRPAGPNTTFAARKAERTGKKQVKPSDAEDKSVKADDADDKQPKKRAAKKS